MATVLLVLHLMIAAGLIGVVLLQRSEGGGLGMGGGGAGGFMTGRGTANLLTRMTAALAAMFFATSIALTLLARQTNKAVSPLDLPQIQPLPKSGGAEKTGGADKSGAPPATPATAPEKGATAPTPATPAPAAGAPTPAAPADSGKAVPPPKSQ